MWQSSGQASAEHTPTELSFQAAPAMMVYKQDNQGYLNA